MNQVEPNNRLANLPPPLPPPDIEPEHLELEALKVCARLRRHGHVAYLVGGCVRDLLAGVEPKDFDVATSARPEEIRAVFRNCRLIGRRFRLAHVYYPNGKVIEVATFRANPLTASTDPDQDGECEEPADLLVTDDNQFGTAEEDALRRDFTVNGLFYDVEEGRVIDFVGGLADLRGRLIHTIGDPEIRMREDPVRGLRAARIAAKLGFDIEPQTFAAMSRHADELPRCAAARVLEETFKILRSGTSRPAFAILRRAGILRVLLPPVERMLSRGGEEAEQNFLSRLGALDAMLEENQQVSEAVMLATVLSVLPLREDETEDDGEEPAGFDEDPEVHAALPVDVDRVLSSMSQAARLPRRIADRVRQILALQAVFHEPPARKKKRRRRSSGGLVRTPQFSEALLLLELLVRATGEGKEALDRWRRKHAEVNGLPVEPEPAPAPAPPPSAESGDKAARRKRRRRRRPKTETETESASASDSPSRDAAD